MWKTTLREEGWIFNNSILFYSYSNTYIPCRWAQCCKAFYHSSTLSITRNGCGMNQKRIVSRTSSEFEEGIRLGSGKPPGKCQDYPSDNADFARVVEGRKGNTIWLTLSPSRGQGSDVPLKATTRTQGNRSFPYIFPNPDSNVSGVITMSPWWLRCH